MPFFGRVGLGFYFLYIDNLYYRQVIMLCEKVIALVA